MLLRPGDYVSDFISLFFPRCCAGCQTALVRGEELICTRCVRELPLTDDLRVADNPVARKFYGRITISQAAAFLKFQKTGTVQRLLHAIKYKNQPELAVLLGRSFGRRMQESGWGSFDLVVPVPLHEVRRRRRGYNQSERIAHGIGESLGAPVRESLLIRKVATSTQTRKSRQERWDNVREAFCGSDQQPARGRILLVDDVITTGATLESCARVLMDSGCDAVSVACLAEAL
jgi:ComF family protein